MKKIAKLKPLKGVQIIDLTRLIPGPVCTKILCDLGATIIKIEDTEKGDYIHLFPTRAFAGESALAVYFHKNKQRMKFDFKKPAGRDILFRLVKSSHVFLESYRPAAMKKWGLDEKRLRRINPRLIYASLTGYGRRSSLSDRAGHDINFMGMSGLLAHFLPQDKKAAIFLPRFQMADFVGGGLFAALMILAAWQQTQKTKGGMFLDLSMTEALVYLNQHFHFAGQAPQMDAICGASARYQIYLTADDKPVCLGALEDKFWFRFCDAAGIPEFKDIGFDPRQNTLCREKLQRLFSSASATHWKNFSRAHDVCLSWVADGADLAQEGWLKPVSIRCRGEKRIFQQSSLLGWAADQSYHKAGAHNAAILKRLGYSNKQVQTLRAQGVIP